MIYVDTPLEYPDELVKNKKRGNMWSHLATDGNIVELHKFATKLGLKKEWFQKHQSVPHYDLIPNKIEMAVNKGAKLVSTMGLFKKCINININIKENEL